MIQQFYLNTKKGRPESSRVSIRDLKPKKVSGHCNTVLIAVSKIHCSKKSIESMRRKNLENGKKNKNVFAWIEGESREINNLEFPTLQNGFERIYFNPERDINFHYSDGTIVDHINTPLIYIGTDNKSYGRKL